MREAPIEQGTVIDLGGAKYYCSRAVFCFGFALSVYVCVCVYFVLRTLRRAALYNNWTVLTPAEQQQWLPYRRNDAGRLDFFPIILGGVFLVPWRVPLALFIVFSNGLWAALLTRATRAEDVWLLGNSLKLKLFRWMLCVSVRLHSRILLYLFGIWRIEEHFPGNGEDEGTHLKRKARVIVSNHVSCLDIPYFMYTSCAAFVSKSVLQQVPFVGDAAVSLNCIFIDRENEADRNLGLQKIKGRCELLHREPDVNPLVIFPEGTTTNGRCLLRFRRGAFCVFHPIQPVVLIYRCSHVDVAYELLPSLDWTLLALSSAFAVEAAQTGLVKLEAYWLPPISPPPADAFKSDDERAVAFASIVREAMWTELCTRRCSSAAASAGKCPDWRGSGKLRMQLEQMLVERQQRDVSTALRISEERDDAHEKAL